MTHKRFTHKKWYDERQLFDGGEAFAIVDSGVQASILCNKLNKLSDENEQLKEKIKREIGHNQRLHSDNCELHKENEQLKQLLDYADDLIQSYMSVHNRDEWENVKKNITGDVE